MIPLPIDVSTMHPVLLERVQLCSTAATFCDGGSNNLESSLVVDGWPLEAGLPLNSLTGNMVDLGRILRVGFNDTLGSSVISKPLREVALTLTLFSFACD